MHKFSSYNDDELISLRGAAAFLGVSENTVARYRDAGKIPFVQYSKRKFFYKVGDLREFIRKSYVRPQDYIE